MFYLTLFFSVRVHPLSVFRSVKKWRQADLFAMFTWNEIRLKNVIFRLCRAYTWPMNELIVLNLRTITMATSPDL